MATALLIVTLLLVALAGAASLWALSLTIYRENWKLLIVGALFPPMLALWLFFHGDRPEEGKESRYLLEGLFLAGSLFMPLWSSALLLVGFLLLETYSLLRNE